MRSTHPRSRWQSLSSFFSRRKRASMTVFPRRVQLRVEGMEDRLLLAVTPSAIINTNTTLTEGFNYLGTNMVTITSS